MTASPDLRVNIIAIITFEINIFIRHSFQIESNSFTESKIG